MPEQNTSANNKRIAKNTIFLYIRMFITMGVALFTSRVVLDKLGVDDYALYNVVGGVVGMLSFLCGTLSIGTSRFLTFEIGRNDNKRLTATFNTAFYTHAILALIIILLMETGGLWFMYNKLVIPPDRLDACFWVLQISILTAVIGILQVPYTSCIMAYERMGIYAYVSIFEAIGKLVVCYMLSTTNLDKLIVYAVLLSIVQVLVASFYGLYCKNKFHSCQLSLSFDKGIFNSLMGFSGWNIMANLTETLKLQGVVLIINMFLSPAVVASQALANQISAAMMQFVNNFRTAINPQIIKLYAAGDREGSKKLTLETTVYCFDMILLLALPCIYVMDTIMHVWLVEVPEYAVIFTQAIFVFNIICTFDAAFYIPMMAANKIKANSIAAVFFGIGNFIFLYIALRLGGGPMFVPILYVLIGVCFSLGVKPFILWKQIDYKFGELIHCYWNCLKVLAFSLLMSLPFKLLLREGIFNAIIIAAITICAVALSSYIFLTKETKVKLWAFVKSKIHIH